MYMYMMTHICTNVYTYHSFPMPTATPDSPSPPSLSSLSSISPTNRPTTPSPSLLARGTVSGFLQSSGGGVAVVSRTRLPGLVSGQVSRSYWIILLRMPMTRACPTSRFPLGVSASCHPSLEYQKSASNDALGRSNLGGRFPFFSEPKIQSNPHPSPAGPTHSSPLLTSTMSWRTLTAASTSCPPAAASSSECRAVGMPAVTTASEAASDWPAKAAANARARIRS